MKIAVFDHQLNYGGGKRFLINLLCALADIDNGIELTLYCDLENARSSYDFYEFEKRKITVKTLESLQTRNIHRSLLNRLIRYAARKVSPSFVKEKDRNEELAVEIATISRDFDVAYFPWPYMLHPPETACPKVATFHDFNFKYFFGVAVYDKIQLKFINESFDKWMRATTPVVSTNFMKHELQNFYPDVKTTHVIHLASLNLYHNSPAVTDDFPEYKFLSDSPYILFPVHITAHKNIGNVIAAASIINKEHVKFRLVITGKHTELISGKSSYLGLINGDCKNADVYGLGYVSDKQMHYLQQKSFAVLNASFYEAGNGVGLDAWPMGIPVIQSNIPAFEEHIRLQGLQAFTFDPRDVHSISKAINECLTDNAMRETYIRKSLLAFEKISWEITARKYLEVFKSLS